MSRWSTTITPEHVAAIFDTLGSDKGRHGYAPFYAGLKEPRAVLEIGVWQGASLRAWRQFWPQARIVGIDLVNRLEHPIAGCEIFTGDACKTVVPGPFDLIIDDGSHDPSEQINAWYFHSRALAWGGVYAIEDVTDHSARALNVTGKWYDLTTGPGQDDRIFYQVAV